MSDPTPADPTAADLRRVILAGTIGAIIEWYDFFLYGIVAGLVLAKLYFPSHSDGLSQFLAYATFAMGFVSRLVGGVIFGHLGDRIGRKAVLVATLLIMGLSTMLIGLLPTYAQIGPAASVALFALRLLQGVGIGGEWGGAVLMAYETAPPGRRGFYAALPQLGLSIGLCLASGVVGLMSLLPDAAFMAWGWRVGFLISVVLVAIGLYIRLRVLETPEFERVRAERRVVRLPLREVLRDHARALWLGMGARCIEGVAFNTYSVFSVLYLSQYRHLPRQQALLAVTLAAVVLSALIPLVGRLSDRWGRPLPFAIGALLLAACAYPSFWLMDHGDAFGVALGVIVPLGVIFALCYAPESALFADLFAAPVRYTGISVVYQLSGVFASGLLPIIATWLLGMGGGSPVWICLYIVVVGLMSATCAVAIYRIRPTT